MSPTKSFSRRRFLQLAGLSATGTVFAACSAKPQPQMPMAANANPIAAAPTPTTDMGASESMPAATLLRLRQISNRISKSACAQPPANRLSCPAPKPRSGITRAR